MGKLLSWVILIALVYGAMRLFVVLQRKSQALAQRRQDAPREPAGPSEPSGEGSQLMLPCARCGVHMPAGDMLAVKGRHYCSAEHRDAESR